VPRKMRTYLSGGMEYAQNEGTDWRKEIEEWITDRLGHTVFNPNVESEKYLRMKLPRVNFRRLKSTDIDRFQETVRGIVRLDSHEIADRTDYVICLWDASAQRGAGTKGELTIARFFGKPVYMVTRMRREKIPGWVLGCTSEIFPSFEALKAFLERSYGRSSV
jgi:hypothetical protein